MAKPFRKGNVPRETLESSQPKIQLKEKQPATCDSSELRNPLSWYGCEIQTLENLITKADYFQ